jgi:hypothetical protein
MNSKTIEEFLAGKSENTLGLFHHFIEAYRTIGIIALYPAKTMIGISTGEKRIAWITQAGKNFIHVVFPFKKPYPDNLCFIKIAQVPGDTAQFNHHFRMFYREDINEEVMNFMRLAYENERP